MNSGKVADHSSQSIGVALVEDDPGMRGRLVRALRAAPQLVLLQAAGTAAEMIDWLDSHKPDVLLVDLGLPDRPGLEVIRCCRLLSPATEVMVITLFGDEANMISAFEAGARGYLLKDGTEEDLARHVLDLHSGGSPMTPVIARQLLDRMAPAAAPEEPTAPKRDLLTSREREILSMLARGYTYAEVARLLELAPTTIQTHVKNIYSKLAVHARAEAVFEARQLGLL